MALSKREFMIMYAALFSLALLVGDNYILSPLLKNRRQVKNECESLRADVEQAQALLKRKKLLGQRWQQMCQAGLGENVEQAESLVFRFVENVSAEHNLRVSSVQPERVLSRNSIGQIEFNVSGSGNMQAVTRFLWEIETAELPVKVHSIQLSGNDENATLMSLQIKLSTIYLKDDKALAKGGSL